MCSKAITTRQARRTALRREPEPPIAVDLFCGCGAVTQGLKQAGFRVLSALDCDPVACETYATNHPDVHLVRDDIRAVEPLSLLPQGSLPAGGVDLLVVCAPCQPFSSQNRHRVGDERADLILQAPRFVAGLRPRLVFFENVPGLASPANHSQIRQLEAAFSAEGYTLGLPVRVDAADYAVPQRRMRCIMFAAAPGVPLPQLPQPITPEGARRTVRDALGDLPPLASGQATADPLHFARNHQEIALQRMRHIPKDGGSRFSLPPELELACHKGHKGHPDVYGRMGWGNVAPTLTTGCTDVTRGRFMHPRDDRAITLREAARLQSFPDEYSFVGCPAAIARQIGNAVPVQLAQVVACSAARTLSLLDQNQRSA
ncbi:DNA cytosine methyltransferase [Nitratidesulfovibrio sp.]|uniref:DNA cytosine methyltransferase n=1 Tax=Nitratidesulfovibrio sp. TaxID=2802297 RepID=UPI0033415120